MVITVDRHAAKEDDQTVAVRLAVPRDLLDCGELGATSESIIRQAPRPKVPTALGRLRTPFRLGAG